MQPVHRSEQCVSRHSQMGEISDPRSLAYEISSISSTIGRM
jgi:hypothetical protein